MEWDLREEAVEVREVGLEVAVGAEWAALLPARLDIVFAPAVEKRCLTSKGFPVQACAARNVEPR
jgi:hypothetical protein